MHSSLRSICAFTFTSIVWLTLWTFTSKSYFTVNCPIQALLTLLSRLIPIFFSLAWLGKFHTLTLSQLRVENLNQTLWTVALSGNHTLLHIFIINGACRAHHTHSLICIIEAILGTANTFSIFHKRLIFRTLLTFFSLWIQHWCLSTFMAFQFHSLPFFIFTTTDTLNCIIIWLLLWAFTCLTLMIKASANWTNDFLAWG